MALFVPDWAYAGIILLIYPQNRPNTGWFLSAHLLYAQNTEKLILFLIFLGIYEKAIAHMPKSFQIPQ